MATTVAKQILLEGHCMTLRELTLEANARDGQQANGPRMDDQGID
jgi:hypothetical protein